MNNLLNSCTVILIFINKNEKRMKIRFMLHKVVSFVCFVSFVLMHLVHEGYPQTQTQQSVSLEKQKEGRTLLVVSATLTGLSLYGPGTARLLDIESGSQIAGLEMLIGGGSFVGALLATRNHRLGAGPLQPNPIGQSGRDAIRFRTTCPV